MEHPAKTEEEIKDRDYLRWKRFGDLPYPKQYHCGRFTCVYEKGCEHCRLYRCVGCEHLRSWAEGGTDSELCDDCWDIVHEAAGELQQIFAGMFG